MSSGWSRRIVGHIDRSTDDVGGIAKPARKPQATSTPVGRPAAAHATISPSAAPWSRPSGTSTRRCPNVSTSRPCTGAPIPAPAASAPATTPATANDPRSARR